MIRETVYLGKDNVIDLLLTADEVATNLSSVTRMIISDSTCGVIIDSSVDEGVFDWSAGDGKLTLTLGQEPVAPGTYTFSLVVYDATNSNGVVWDNVEITFKSIC